MEKKTKKEEITPVLYKSNMLLKLVKEHKAKCEDPHCDISTFIVYSTFYKPFLTENGYISRAAEDFRHFI